jgi:hypothetical protein
MGHGSRHVPRTPYLARSSVCAAITDGLEEKLKGAVFQRTFPVLSEFSSAEHPDLQNQQTNEAIKNPAMDQPGGRPKTFLTVGTELFITQ